MLKNRIIPCLDVKNGRVVKGINFLDLRDAGDPVEQAAYYDKSGADEICFLDITATHEERNIILETVKKTADKCFVPLTVGGGIRTIEDIRKLLIAGTDKVSINTAAIKDPTFIKRAAQKFGSQCIVVAVDAKKTGNQKWEIFSHGGRKKTGIDAIEFSKQSVSNGAGEILLTSMDKDGTKSGYDLDLLKIITVAYLGFLVFNLDWISVLYYSIQNNIVDSIFTSEYAVNWASSVSSQSDLLFKASSNRQIIASNTSLDLFYNNALIVFLSYALTGLLIIKCAISKNIILKVLSILIVAMIFFTKGMSPPFGLIYAQLMENVPFFYIFKTPTEKFGLLLNFIIHKFINRFMYMMYHFTCKTVMAR